MSKFSLKDRQKLVKLRDDVLARGISLINEAQLGANPAFAKLKDAIVRQDDQVVILDRAAVSEMLKNAGMADVQYADLSYGYRVGYTFDSYGGALVHHISVSCRNGRIRDSFLVEIARGLGVVATAEEHWTTASAMHVKHLIVRVPVGDFQ